MALFQSFFIDAVENNQCEELNTFIKTHSVIRTVENLISTPLKTGIQVLVEYRETQNSATSEKTKKIDYRAMLPTEEKKIIFDKLKEFRAAFAKENKLVGAYMVCKDEHLYQIADKPEITVDEISKLPHSGNIFIKEYAKDIYKAYQNILKESKKDIVQKNEESSIPF